jgi:nicotinate dehydrogenase subunit B
VIHVILRGIQPPEGTVGAIMPAFADTLNDGQVEQIVAYLRARFSSAPQWSNIAGEVGRVRGREASP